MAVIKSISLNNFRIFDKMTKFELAPLTILTGANNSGKSSLIKALLLLADNAKKNGFKSLDFSDDTHHLDSFEYVKNRDSNNNLISFAIDFAQVEFEELSHLLYENFFMDTIKLQLTYKENGETGELVAYSIWVNETRLYEITKNIQNKHSLYINLRLLLHKSDTDLEDLPETQFFINHTIISSESENLLLLDKIIEKYICNFEVVEADYTKRWQNSGDFFSKKRYESANIEDIHSLFLAENLFQENLFDGENKFNRLLGDILTENEKNLFPNYLAIPIIEIVIGSYFYRSRNYLREIEDFIYTNLVSIAKQTSLGYIECFKANSKRMYLNQFQGTGFNELLLKASRTNFRPEIQQFIIKWLKEFKIGDDFKLFRESGIATKVKIIRGRTELDLVDLGFGYTQIFPLILQIALYGQEQYVGVDRNISKELKRRVDKNRYSIKEDGQIAIRNLSNDYGYIFSDDERYKSKVFSINDLFPYFTILVEEPEANLHPKLQSKLADLFLDASDSFGFQFIIETHSEYFIRRVQILVANRAKEIKEFQKMLNGREVTPVLEQVTNTIIADHYQLSPNSIRLYYFYEPDNVPKGCNQIEEITILPDGRLDKEFGEGFFDEATNLQIELLKLKNRIN